MNASLVCFVVASLLVVSSANAEGPPPAPVAPKAVPAAATLALPSGGVAQGSQATPAPRRHTRLWVGIGLLGAGASVGSLGAMFMSFIAPAPAPCGAPAKGQLDFCALGQGFGKMDRSYEQAGAGVLIGTGIAMGLVGLGLTVSDQSPTPSPIPQVGLTPRGTTLRWTF